MAMRIYISGLICLMSALIVVQSQTIADEFNNVCTAAESCGECIRTSPMCAWCGMENFPRSLKRCDLLLNIRKNCNETDITDPQLVMKPTEDKAWTSGNVNKAPVQVKPQAIEFKLRPNEPINFKVKFQQQANYPVDLYFLLDLSYGMVRQEARERLIALGNDIGVAMNNITNNFKLGFGTFVDKRLMPYSPWTQQMLNDRCPNEGSSCREPHDYKNEVNLAKDPQSFATRMEQALRHVSQSLDDAEGGLDGLIQALDCEDIGWREVSRRIIVYSSNSLFHLAGDGKLGGATKQSDLKCSLSPAGLYDKALIYDYPSVSEIASKLREKNANIIFAVMANVANDYRQLSGFLDGAVVGQLEEDSKNIVQLISNKYYELRSKVKFQAENADHVDVSFQSKCLGDVMKDTAECVNLEIMDSVEFDVNMVVRQDICKGESGVFSKEVTLKAIGLNEQVKVLLNVSCECECELPGNEVPDSDKCAMGNGTYECGTCACNPGRYGRHCECDQSTISSEESLQKCRRNKNETLVCEGKGDCLCGECDCWRIRIGSKEEYSGSFCECNDYNCPYDNEGLCGGPKRGVCNCGKCECQKGWSGDICECSTDQTKCMASTGTLCNNNGTCVCGKCECTEGSKWFGPTCEECPTCPTQCSEHFACAQCTEHFPGTLTRDECTAQCPNVEDVPELPEEGDGVRRCQGTSPSDGCTIFFTYEYNDKNEVLIYVQETKKCPEEAPLAAIIGGTVAAVVLIPLFIICLIIIIRNRRDAKEYANFLNEKKNARWESGANPIYKDPKSTFQNPTYKGNSGN